MSIFRELLAKQNKPESQFKIVAQSQDGKWLKLSNGTVASFKNIDNGVKNGFISEDNNVITLSGKGRAFAGNPILTSDGKQIKVTAFTDKEQTAPTVTF